MRNNILLGIATIIATFFIFCCKQAHIYTQNNYDITYSLIVQIAYPIVIGLLVGLLRKEIVHVKKEAIGLLVLLLLNIISSIYIFYNEFNISIYNLILIGYIFVRMITILAKSLRIKLNK